MKILRVISSMDPVSGGPCQGIRNIIPELEKLNVQNEVVCLDEPAAPFLQKDRIVIHALGGRKTGWNYSSNLLPWLLENLQRFDIVIIHGLWLYHGYAVKKAVDHLKKRSLSSFNSKSNIPKVYVMPHGMLDPYFQSARERKVKALRNWLYWKLIESAVVNKANGVLFTCETELLLARIPFRPYKPTREINIGYGIAEPPPYLPYMQEAFISLCPEVEDAPYLLFLSRIHEKKGVDILLKAFAEVKKTQGSRALSEGKANEDIGTIKLVIAGPGGETDYGKKLKELVANDEILKNHVFFPGMLSGAAKWGAFYGSEAFVLPSHQENFGIAVVEALACGKAVIISDKVNIWKEIDTLGGGIVGKDTIKGTVNSLQHWTKLAQPEKYAMSVKAKTTFKQRFEIEKASKYFLEAFKTLAANEA